MRRETTHTSTDDTDDGSLPCPWCGSHEGDVWEKSTGEDECSACGGGREITEECTRTVYARRTDKRPDVDVTSMKRVTQKKMLAYLSANEWLREDDAFGMRGWVVWRPAVNIDGFVCDADDGDKVYIGTLRIMLDIAAKHEKRSQAEVLRDIVAMRAGGGEIEREREV